MNSQTQQLKVSSGNAPPAWLAQVPRPLFGRPQNKQVVGASEPKAPEAVPEVKCEAPEAMPEVKGNAPPAWLAQVPRPLFGRPQREQGPETSKAAEPVVELSKAAPDIILVESSESESEPEAILPPVTAVKKNRHRGCARVLLRDPAIIERCVLQRVAVIDGVCVEMTRHTKKSKSQEEGREAEAGIFVAWGKKVEEKVPVSEEGLEEFFNSLAGKPCPEGLVARPPFQDGHVSFPLTSEAFLPLSWSICPMEASQKEISSGTYCHEDLVKAQCAAKGRLDDLWERPPPPMARSLMTRVARSQLFPCSGTHGKGDKKAEDGKEDKEHENRAGDKLAEIIEITDLLDGIPAGSAFLDLCGGPGAWSQHLLAKKDLALRGFGFTLQADAGAAEDWKAEAKDEWYEDLYEHPNWTALWGADRTGDLLKPGNLEHAVQQLAKEQVLLVAADGGFSDDSIPKHLQELYFYRLFLGELYMAVSCLGQGGKFVCKLYSTFSASTAALLFLTTRLFEEVEVVKPQTSKATGPERYLVASGFLDNAESSAIQSALERAHAAGRGASPLVTPLLSPLVEAAILSQDQKFTASMKTMVSAFCERQTLALNAVVDRAVFLEDMAMECAVCTDPFSKMVTREERTRDFDRFDHIATPARAGARKGNGKGKAKGTSKGKSRTEGPPGAFHFQ